jgi:hypothetical protein
MFLQTTRSRPFTQSLSRVRSKQSFSLMASSFSLRGIFGILLLLYVFLHLHALDNAGRLRQAAAAP